MTYYGPKELAASFRTVRKNTIQIAEEIPEERYSFRAAPDTRSVAETLAHIAIVPRVPQQIHFIERRSTLVGFDFLEFIGKLAAEEPAPRSQAAILALLRTEGVTENFLAEQVEYPQGMLPPIKSRFEMLLGAKEHEMHHRGQLMLIERMIGITPHLTRHMQERVAAMQTAQSAT
jgi:uncharacterized damage-inducible protein DinB